MNKNTRRLDVDGIIEITNNCITMDNIYRNNWMISNILKET